MEVIRLGEFNPKTLEEKVTIQPLKCATEVANNNINNHACLRRLDYLLDFLEESHKSKIPLFIDNLKKKLESMLKKKILLEVNSNLTNILKKLDKLKKFPELVEVTLALNLQLLNMPETSNWLSESVEVKRGDYIRSYLIPNYYYLEIMMDTFGRKEAIKIFKQYLSSFLAEISSQFPTNYTTLTDTFNSRKKAKDSPSDWVIVIGLVSEGKYFFRNDNCLWVDALEDLPDKEIKYYICCFGDYQIAYSRSNGYVVLTMEHTLAEGDPYCSRVKHDTRFDWDLTHPKKEVFDKLWPVQK